MPPRSLLQTDRNPDGFPKAFKNVGNTYVSAMVVAIDALLASSGTAGPAWDLHEEPLENLANACLFIVGSATRGRAPKSLWQLDQES